MLSRPTETPAAAPPRRASRPERPAAHGLSGWGIARVLVLSTLLTWIGCLWIREAEWIGATIELTGAVPPIPALAGLLFLAGVTGALHLARRRVGMSRGEVLAVFVVLTLSISMASGGVVTMMLGWVAGAYYHPTDFARVAGLREGFPAWLVPRDAEAMRQFHEGSRGAGVPWDVWAVPLLSWSLFLFLLLGTTLCLAALFYRPWAEHERLRFPLAQFIVEVSDVHSGPGGRKPIYRNGFFWLGFGLAALFNFLNMASAVSPAWPKPGTRFMLVPNDVPMGPLYPLRGLMIQYEPLLFGIGWLVSLELLFSVWASYLLVMGQAVLGYRLGLPVVNSIFPRDQAVGAFVALALAMCWMSRGHIRYVFRHALGLAPAADEDREPLPHRAIVFGALAGLFGVGAFFVAAGMHLWVAALYLFLLITFALVYTRIRVEMGAAMIWLFPIYRQYQFFLHAFPSSTLVPGGNLQSLGALTLFGFLAQGTTPELMAFQMEGFKLGDEGRVGRRTMAWLSLFGVAMGLPFAYYFLLGTYYEHGANLMGTWKGYHVYPTALSYAGSAVPPDPSRAGWAGAGFVTALGLLALRLHLPWFPLHPLGYAVATAKGHTVWGVFFLVWLIKFQVLRFGGRPLYVRLVPLFLGIALGHLFVAGVVWGGLGSTGADLFRAYKVWFS